ncbi:MAG: hypothetical protein ACOCWD_05740 [Tangfeifania sp.]
MKRKVNKKNYTEVDNFERKSKKSPAQKDKRSKRKLSIYDDFEDEELDDYYLSRNSDFDEDEEDLNE